MGSPKSADHVNLGELIGKGVAQIRRSSVERFDASRGCMVGSGASSLHDYFDYQARVLRTLVIFHRRPSFVFKFTTASIPFYVTACLFY